MITVKHRSMYTFLCVTGIWAWFFVQETDNKVSKVCESMSGSEGDSLFLQTGHHTLNVVYVSLQRQNQADTHTHTHTF